MEKKKLIILVVSMVFLVGIFAVITVSLTTSETNRQAAEMEGNGTKADASGEGKMGETSLVGGGKEAAEDLIDKTVSRDEVKESVGEWERFEMDGNGCERGVYAGKFYYGDFTIYSRTYDKGETFHIMSVNE